MTLFFDCYNVKVFDDSLLNGMIFIDLHKVFDMINHDIILGKLSITGFPNHTVKMVSILSIQL